MAWTDERVALLKRYWAEGHSASQIAELLGDGLSRNAVIGKAHRMGLASRPSPLKVGGGSAGKPATSGRATRKKAAPAAAVDGTAMEAAPPADAGREKAAPAAPATPSGAPAPEASRGTAAAATTEARRPLKRPAAGQRAKGARVTLLDLNEKICKWPIGHPDKAGFHFCGKPANPGFPYCVEHCLVAYQAQLPRRDRSQGEQQPAPAAAPAQPGTAQRPR